MINLLLSHGASIDGIGGIRLRILFKQIADGDTMLHYIVKSTVTSNLDKILEYIPNNQFLLALELKNKDGESVLNVATPPMLDILSARLTKIPFDDLVHAGDHKTSVHENYVLEHPETFLRHYLALRDIMSSAQDRCFKSLATEVHDMLIGHASCDATICQRVLDITQNKAENIFMSMSHLNDVRKRQNEMNEFGSQLRAVVKDPNMQHLIEALDTEGHTQRSKLG